MALVHEVFVGGVRRARSEKRGTGTTVRCVRQGVEGLGLVSRRGPAFDADLAAAQVEGDVGLPERDALRLARDALQGQGRESLDASRDTIDNRKADGPRLIGHEPAKPRGVDLSEPVDRLPAPGIGVVLALVPPQVAPQVLAALLVSRREEAVRANAGELEHVEDAPARRHFQRVALRQPVEALRLGIRAHGGQLTALHADQGSLPLEDLQGLDPGLAPAQCTSHFVCFPRLQ